MMRRSMMCAVVCSLAVVLASAGFAQAREIDWQKMDEDVLVMKKLVNDTLERVLSGRTAPGEPPPLAPLSFDVIEPTDVPGVLEEEVAAQYGRARVEVRASVEQARRRAEQTAEVARRLQAKARRSGWWPLRSGVHAIYLPGYGALFAAEVRSPVALSQLPSEAAPAEKPGGWEKAKQDLYGIPSLPTFEPKLYDKEAVQKVKDALAELLATEAKNFTQLPEDERVTVFICGPVGGQEGQIAYRVFPADSGAKKAKYFGAEEGEHVVVGETRGVIKMITKGSLAAPQRTVLTVSVKASDLAAQREAKLTAEDVKERIEISQR